MVFIFLKNLNTNNVEDRLGETTARKINEEILKIVQKRDDKDLK